MSLADRHARARRDLQIAESGLSWIDAHDTPTPAPIVAACRRTLSRGAALALDELAGVDLETMLNVLRGAIAAGPEALAAVDRELAREPVLPDPCPDRPLTA